MDTDLEQMTRAQLIAEVNKLCEIRQVFEAEDFGAEFTPELREQEERILAQATQHVKGRTREVDGVPMKSAPAAQPLIAQGGIRRCTPS